jgi:hypothetical protein
MHAQHCSSMSTPRSPGIKDKEMGVIKLRIRGVLWVLSALLVIAGALVFTVASDIYGSLHSEDNYRSQVISKKLVVAYNSSFLSHRLIIPFPVLAGAIARLINDLNSLMLLVVPVLIAIWLLLPTGKTIPKSDSSAHHPDMFSDNPASEVDRQDRRPLSGTGQ